MINKVLRNILEDSPRALYGEKQHYINTNNNGIMLSENLEYEKRKMIKDSISYLADELVDANQEYPYEDISEVHLKIDAVIMPRKDFEFLKKYMEEFLSRDEQHKIPESNE